MTREPADAHATVLERIRQLLVDVHAFIDPEQCDYGDGEVGDRAALLTERVKHALGTCHECDVNDLAALRAREDAGPRADGTRFRAAVEAYDAYMAAQFREGPSSSAIHPNARAMWLQARAALAASPAPAPTTGWPMTGEQLAVIADDIADMAQDYVTARDARSLRNSATNLARMIRLHVPSPAPPDTGGPR